MAIKKGISAVFLMLTSLMVFAQFSRLNTQVFDGNDQLKFGLVGGLIAPQFSEVDLNNDGTQDLFIFDKAGNVPLTFINNGAANQVDYVYASQYEKHFPEMRGFVLLRDYNGDGIQDLFTYSDVPGIDGMIVYTGKYSGGVIQFERFDFTSIISSNTIPFPAGNGFTQLYITDQDYPAITDLDDDGDLDILTFAVGGGHVYLFENQSVEMGYGQDSLIYTLEDDCYGNFYESGLSEIIDLADSPTMCVNGFHDNDPNAELRHAGSTLLTFDNDADGDQELLLGDISFSNLNLLTNGGTADEAFMVSQDTFFPSYNLSADIKIFPASYYLDVDNDGVKDLLASPNVFKTGENHEVVWRYQNSGANNQPNFQFVEKDFLVDEMIDMGIESHPTFVDYNADGLMDMVVGNSSFYRPFGEKAPRIFLFENIGTMTNPKFELVDEDYLNFSVFESAGNFSPAPTFGDVDNDGDMDVLIGEDSGGFFFGENTAGAGNTINIPSLQFAYMGLDLGVHSVPQFIDLNRDGKLDILAGEKVGRLVYFQNDGTLEEPMFVPNIDFNTPGGNNIITIGLVDTRLGLNSGYASPFIYDFDGDYGLISGSEKGNILKYSNIDGNLDGDFTLDDDFFGKVRPGFRTAPVLIDINNNGVLDMFIGNMRGGITAYKTNLMTDGTVVSNEEISDVQEVNLYPNPSNGQVSLEIENPDFSEAGIMVYNSIGQLIYRNITQDKITEIATNNWAAGLYIVQVEIGAEVLVKKLIVN